VEVYFDDFKVTHVNSPVVNTDDYYPSGFAFNSYQRENSVANQYQCNGKERQDELNLGLYDYGFRLYDPAIGRWSAPDPLAELGFSLTPYRYCFNNPVNYTDPFGLWEQDANGNYSTNDQGDIKRLLSYLTTESYALNNNPSIEQINGFIGGEESEGGLGTLSDGSQLVSAVNVNGYQQGNRVDWYTDKKSFNNAWHEIQGDLTPDALDTRTVGHQFWGLTNLTYPGGQNPLKYNGKFDYTYVPKSLGEYPAIGHDKRYDNLGITNAGKALFMDSRTIGADWKFVKEEFLIATLPIGTKEQIKAAALGAGLGFFASFKTLIQIATPQGCVETGMWYSISSQDVTNAPDKPE